MAKKFEARLSDGPTRRLKGSKMKSVGKKARRTANRRKPRASKKHVRKAVEDSLVDAFSNRVTIVNKGGRKPVHHKKSRYRVTSIKAQPKEKAGGPSKAKHK